jgi:uncharacterized membrane protein
MFGFLFGTVCLFALFKVMRRGRYGYGRFGGWGHAPAFGCSGRGGGHHGGYDRGGWNDDDVGGGFGFGGWRGGRGGFVLRALFEQLDTTPGQEKAIAAALAELREKGRAVKDEARDARGDLARAFRGESLDAETLGTAAARASTAIDGLRDAGIGALLKVHEVLDPRQRAILADLLERGPRFGGYRRRDRGNPYRDVAEV